MIEGPLIPFDRYLVASLPEIWFGIVLGSLALYVALDGFDFGIGMLYATRHREADRETFLAAFGPVWDANEVWLVAFGTTLLAAFPRVYSRLLAEHYLVALGAVVALLFRGVAPELREQRHDARWQRACDRLFVAGSVLAPLLLGTLVGAWAFGTGSLGVPSLLTGVAFVALSVANGAAFLSAKTPERLAAELRRYGVAATVAYLAGVVVLLGVLYATDPAGARATLTSLPTVGAVLASVLVGVAGLALARRGADRAWLASTLTLSVLFVAVAATFLYPTVYPASGLTVREAVVSPLALNLVTILGVPALALVFWYFRILYGTFSGPVEGDGYGG